MDEVGAVRAERQLRALLADCCAEKHPDQLVFYTKALYFVNHPTARRLPHPLATTNTTEDGIHALR